MPVVNAYILVVLGILCAKAAGFLRDAVFAAYFGTGIESDIYFQIFGIASLIFTAVGSALSTLVIKNINKTKYSYNGGQKKYAAYFIRRISLMILGVTAILYLAAPYLVKMLLHKIEGEDFYLALRIMYIMLPSFLFICVAYIMSGLLQNRRAFFIPSVMSLPYNVIVICVLLLGERDIEKISMVTTFGWFLHIAVQLPSFYRKGYSFFEKTDAIDKGYEKSNVLETFYIFVSGLMLQLAFMTDKIFASYDTGMASTLSYGSNLFITFSGMFVVAMSSVVFPAISQNYEHGEMDYVRELIRYMIKLMASIFTFYIIAVIFFGDFAISTIYERGAFTREDTVRVTMAFVIYSFAIFGYWGQNILNKLFYLAGKYRITVTGAIIAVALNAAIDYFLAPLFGVYALALSSTVILTLYAVFIAVKLKSIIGSYITKELLTSLGKIALSGAVTAGFLILWSFVAPDALITGLMRLVPFFISVAVFVLSMLLTGMIKELFATPLSKMK